MGGKARAKVAFEAAIGRKLSRRFPDSEIWTSIRLPKSRDGVLPTRSDSDIRRDVEDELRWDPDIDATDIAVSVSNGVVTLAGFVRSYMQKYHADSDAKRVAGVLGVANDLEVRLPGVDERPDPFWEQRATRWSIRDSGSRVVLWPPEGRAPLRRRS